ncbi:unnamed protein product, partial [Porites lobata]
LQHCSNIATLCSAKNRRCKSFRVTSTKSEEEEKEALFESRRAVEVAKARSSLSLQTIWMLRFFFQAGICKASLKSMSVSSTASDDPADIHSLGPNYYNTLESSLTPPSAWRWRL